MVFFAAVLAAGFFVVVVLAFATVLLAGLALAAFAFAAARFFILAALFLWISPFFNARSILLCASECVLALGLADRLFIEPLRARLVLLLRIEAFRATCTRFFADLIIGILFYPVKLITVLNYTRGYIANAMVDGHKGQNMLVFSLNYQIKKSI